MSTSIKGFLLVSALALVVFALPKNSVKTDMQAEAEESIQEVSALTRLIEATNSEGNLRLRGVSEIKDERVNYSFVVQNEKNKTELELFEISVDRGVSLTIPYNSWSPDYKYVFINVNMPGKEDYYVFNANGDDFDGGAEYLSVGEYWKESEMGTKIKEVSGWAGDDLLMVYSTNEDGSEGPAYWFLIGSRKFTKVRQF